MRRQGSGRPKSTPNSTVCALPCPEEIRPEVWSAWSDVRKLSYVQVQEPPHAYYYRHLPPGEKQRNGTWTAAKRKLFFDRMAELRGNADTFTGCWGTFSLAIFRQGPDQSGVIRVQVNV
jgi:hypothetical protein